MMDVELIVPQGWAHVPTTPELSNVRARTISAVVQHTLPDSLPRDKAEPYRRMLTRQLTDATDEAERRGARAVIMPVQEMHGMRLPGTLLLSVIEDNDESQDPKLVLDEVLADAGADGTALELDGCPAARTRQIVDSSAIDRKHPAVRVNYLVSAPGRPGVWAVLTFTVLTDGDVEAEAVQAVVLLFDAVVSTLRWAEDPDVPTEDELLARLPADSSGN
jgi:hypothetical protein